MPHNIEEIERLAMSGCDVPKEYNQPEQLLFLSLRILHWEYRHGIITLEQAKGEKHLLVQEFQREQQFHEIYMEDVRIRNTMSHRLTAAEKNGCPHCRELVQIFDGRKRV